MARANIKKQKVPKAVNSAMKKKMKQALGHYILVGKKVKEVPLMEWSNWIETTKDRFMFSTRVGRLRVSTVFLGLDYSFGGKRKVLFQTMVFRTAKNSVAGKSVEPHFMRYSTYAEAEAGHKAMCEQVQRERGGKISTKNDYKKT